MGKNKISSKINHKKASILFESFVENIYIPRAKVRKRSWQVDERIFRQHIFPFFQGKTLEDIKREDIEDWQNSLLVKSLAPSTCNRILVVMKTICKLAEQRGYCPVSPCRDVERLTVYAQRDTYLSLEQTALLLSELEEHDSLEALALRLILLTGARKNEILKAKWENVRVGDCMLVVPISKSGKPRFILLSKEALKVIAAIPRNGEYLFPSKKNKNKPLSDIYYYWNQVRQKLNLHGVRIHDLRHTYASVLVNNGYSLYVAQGLLGHASSSTTLRYAHLDKATLLDAAESTAMCMISGKRHTISVKYKKQSVAGHSGLNSGKIDTFAEESTNNTLLYEFIHKYRELADNNPVLEELANMVAERLIIYICSIITGEKIVKTGDQKKFNVVKFLNRQFLK